MKTKIQQVQSLIESVRARYSTPKGIAHYEKGAREWGASEWEKAMIRLYMIPLGSVLDVGCGAGRISIELSRMGYSVTGIDITSGLLNAAKKLSEEYNLDVTFQKCDGLKLDFPDASFQYVLLNQMIGHVPLRENRVGLFQECARVVSQTGCIVLNYDDIRIVKAQKLWGSDKPPDSRAIEKAQGYSILENEDRFENPIRGRNKDGSLDEDIVFGYKHEFVWEEIESELGDAGLTITNHISVTELPDIPDERSPCHIITAVPQPTVGN